MKTRHYAGVSLLLVLYLAGLAVYANRHERATERVNGIDASLVAEGRAVYAAHCAACHGDQLQGQADWRRPGPDGRLPAPPHDASGHTWHHPDEYLIHVVEQGIVAGVDRPIGYQGNMPAFGTVLSRAQTLAVLGYIKSTWPSDHRQWQEATNTPLTAAPQSGSAETVRAPGSR